MQNGRFRASELAAIFAAAIVVCGGMANAGPLDATQRFVVVQAPARSPPEKASSKASTPASASSLSSMGQSGHCRCRA